MNQLPPQIHKSWYKYLQPLFDDPKMNMIKENIKGGYYPLVNQVFRVFEMPINQIRVCIVGMDPYINGEAIGLAFAVNEDNPMPASLKIINNEIVSSRNFMKNPEIWQQEYVEPIRWRTLQHWVDQGVFLLNAALTVEPRNSGSHTGYWLWFTKAVVKAISEVVKPVWLLWGRDAQGFTPYITNAFVVKNIETIEYDIVAAVAIAGLKENTILIAPHPAAEKYNPSNKFTGCNHFNVCNYILKLKGLKEINW